MDTNDASSQGSLSSVPHSPEQGTPGAGRGASGAGAGSASASGVGVAASSTPTPANATSPAPHGLTASGVPRKKPGPKPKQKDPNAPEPDKKVRKTRKVSEFKEVVQPGQRKQRRTKTSLDPQPGPPDLSTSTSNLQHHQQSVAGEIPLVRQPSSGSHRHGDPVNLPVKSEHASGASLHSSRPPNSASTEPAFHGNPNLSHINVAPSTPRPSSSGQRYDPVRGNVFASKPQTIPTPVSPPLNRASASPSITSLIDPPSASNSFYSHNAKAQQSASVTSAPVSPAAFAARSALVVPSHDVSPHSLQQHLPQQAQHSHSLGAAATNPIVMDIDSDSSRRTSAPMTKTISAQSGTPANSNAPTPPAKPARNKEAPPPMPTGSGLLSGTPFGPVVSANGTSDTQGANIWLTFNLKGRDNVTINFAQEVEKKYGFAALHPRIAARRERQRQITAAGAALERAGGTASNDDMSVDLSENESNVEMGGVDDDASVPENGVKKRKKRKQEEYDKEDDFIDDTELAWEQQALMAKDGFFVYSGPLVTEEKPSVTRADGTVRRGRGRGRGGSTRGETSGRGRGRGGGPGSRGGTTVRKPRVTKADRALMEQEKKERESLAATMAAKQPVAPYAGQAGVM